MRVIINSQSAAAFTFMYSTVFDYLRDAYDINVSWFHIHGHGIRGVTIDQDWGDIVGKYLLIYY